MSYADTLMRTTHQLDAARKRVAWRYSLARWVVRVVRLCLRATKTEAERRRALAAGTRGGSFSLMSLNPVVFRDNRTRVLYETRGGLAWYELHTRVRARLDVETWLCARYQAAGLDQVRRASDPPSGAES